MNDTVKILDKIPFTPDREAFYKKIRLDGFPELKNEVDRFLDTALERLQPKALFKESFIDERNDRTIIIEGQQFESPTLSMNLREVEKVFPYIAGCGNEIEDMDLSGYDFLADFWRDALKETALNTAIENLQTTVSKDFGVKKFSSMNPGSADAEVWPIEQQEQLFALFGNVEEMIGVRLTESFLMMPNKSVSGMFFASDERYINCQVCSRENCPRRRAEFTGMPG